MEAGQKSPGRALHILVRLRPLKPLITGAHAHAQPMRVVASPNAPPSSSLPSVNTCLQPAAPCLLQSCSTKLRLWRRSEAHRSAAITASSTLDYSFMQAFSCIQNPRFAVVFLNLCPGSASSTVAKAGVLAFPERIAGRSENEQVRTGSEAKMFQTRRMFTTTLSTSISQVLFAPTLMSMSLS